MPERVRKSPMPRDEPAGKEVRKDDKISKREIKFASFWISDLICKSKRQKKLKHNNVKIKEGILTDPVTVVLGFSFS